MMVMTAKLNFKKILVILCAAAAVILSLILLLGGGPEEQAQELSGNAARVQFLKSMGWEVSDQPTQSGQVKIPKTASQVYERYNNLQKSQGYDLSPYAGKKVMRYVYQVSNYPGATSPVYATLLLSKDQIIGGDITDSGAGGKIRGLRKSDSAPDALPQPSAPTAPALPETTIPETREATVPETAGVPH